MIILIDKTEIAQFLTEWQAAPFDGNFRSDTGPDETGGYPSIKTGYAVLPHPDSFQPHLVQLATTKAIPLAPTSQPLAVNASPE